MKLLAFSSLVILFSFAAGATQEILGIQGPTPQNSFITHYNAVQAGAGTQEYNCYGCNMCHTSATQATTDLTAFASNFLSKWSVQETMMGGPGINDRAPDAAALAAWGQMDSTDGDSDTDGTHDLEEIKGATNPGDKNSTPASPNCLANVAFSPPPNAGNLSNPNVLNPSCGGHAAGLGLIADNDKHGGPKGPPPAMVIILLPLALLAALRLSPRSK